MCQLCDEADAYLAEIEARAKKREEEQRKAGNREQDQQFQEDRKQGARGLH